MTNSDFLSFATNPDAPAACDTVECAAEGCQHRIFFIPERRHAHLCLDHALAADIEILEAAR